jgi:mRNA-degrading endonuclease RelE of RelBE toxin-antitoxin system
MTPKSKPKVLLTERAFEDLQRLPGNVRRQIIVHIDGLEKNIRPSNSKPLVIEGEPKEIRRLRSGKWRIIYLVMNERPVIIGIRHRPPYDYEDIKRLLEDTD